MAEHICPHCKNPTYDDEALLCHFCGESLGRYSSGGIGAMRAMRLRTECSEGVPRPSGRGVWKWVFAIIAGLIVLTFLLSLGL